LQACREALNKPVKDELSPDSCRAAAAKVLDAAQEALVRGQVNTALGASITGHRQQEKLTVSPPRKHRNRLRAPRQSKLRGRAVRPKVGVIGTYIYKIFFIR
jgi:hypothetical protein